MTKWGGGGEEERDGKQEGENSAVASRYFRRITTIWSYAWKRLLSPSLPLFLPLRVYQYPVITDRGFKINLTEIRASVVQFISTNESLSFPLGFKIRLDL